MTNTCEATFATAPTAVAGSIVEWMVPVTGTYVIRATSGQGGAGGTPNNYAGGAGAEATGIFSLTAGQTLDILVAGNGNVGYQNSGGGGGGGSFVVLSEMTPLVVAGGGGGAGEAAAGALHRPPRQGRPEATAAAPAALPAAGVAPANRAVAAASLLVALTAPWRTRAGTEAA